MGLTLNDKGSLDWDEVCATAVKKLYDNELKLNKKLLKEYINTIKEIDNTKNVKAIGKLDKKRGELHSQLVEDIIKKNGWFFEDWAEEEAEEELGIDIIYYFVENLLEE